MLNQKLSVISAATIATTRLWAGGVTDELRWSNLPPLPNAHGVAGAFAGVADGRLIVAGGANFPEKMPWDGGQKVWHDSVYYLEWTSAQWQVGGRLPRPLGYGVSLTTAHGVLCVGGSDARQHHADVFLLSFAHNEVCVKPLPSLPVPLANAAGALVAETAYVFGGSEKPGEQVASRRLFALDIEARESGWQELPPCPGEARILPAAGATPDTFYLAGGAALHSKDGKVKRTYLRDVWKFSPKSRRWDRLADLPKPSVAAPSPAPVIDATLLLVGGDDGSLADFQPLERHPGFPRTGLALDLRTGRWAQFAGLPAARATLPVVEWNGLHVLPSGETRPGVRSPEVWTLRRNGTN